MSYMTASTRIIHVCTYKQWFHIHLLLINLTYNDYTAYIYKIRSSSSWNKLHKPHIHTHIVIHIHILVV